MGGAHPGTLWVVGTPLGNLGDLSPRARLVFSEVDVILCEDTRVSAKLFGPHEHHAPLERADAQALSTKVPALLARLQNGAKLALVSDAGMPTISDPGARLIDAARDAGIAVEVVPGPCAVSCALAASGLFCDRYFFQGFLARKGRARARQLQWLAALPAAVVIYESPYRVQKTLEDLSELVGRRRVALCRELTKLHQEVLRGSPKELLRELKAREAQGRRLKGECVIVVEAPTSAPMGSELAPCSVGGKTDPAALAKGAPNTVSGNPAPPKSSVAWAQHYLAQGMAPTQATKALAQALGISRQKAYAAVIEAQRSNKL